MNIKTTLKLVKLKILVFQYTPDLHNLLTDFFRTYNSSMKKKDF